jgi:prepilin-type N-terminal cleavage/methylation domain-containing protein
MRFIPTPHRNVRGFSLIELSVVVAIISVVAALGLEAAANFVNRTSGAVTRERLVVADEAVNRFFKIYGRLPCPASRAVALAAANSSFGVEDCTIAVWTADAEYVTLTGGGLVAGMLPYRTLNIPMTYALDGFNNKLNYVVTKNLTVAGGSATILNRFGSTGGAAATNGIAGIEIRTGVLEEPCGGSKCQKVADPSTSTGAAYILFSNGTDQRGAVPVRATSVATACSASTARVDSMNCQWGANGNTTSVTTIPKNVFYDNRYNAGLNLASYFDDYVIWRSKAQL